MFEIKPPKWKDWPEDSYEQTSDYSVRLNSDGAWHAYRSEKFLCANTTREGAKAGCNCDRDRVLRRALKPIDLDALASRIVHLLACELAIGVEEKEMAKDVIMSVLQGDSHV